MSVREFKLPDLGEGLTESELVSWHVAVGDTVELNQVIADVETAKAVVQVPSPFAGVVTKLYEEAGATVQVGAPIMAFEVEGADADNAGDGVPSPVDAAAPAARNSVLVGYGPPVETGGRPRRRARGLAIVPQPTSAEPITAEPINATPISADPINAAPRPVAVAPAPVPQAVAEPIEIQRERPRSTPPVRKLARDLGIDLAGLIGTGEGGLITREDVQAAAAPAVSPVAEPAPAAGERETRIPIKGVRKYTAAAMVSSAFTAPHVSEFLTVDITPTMDLIARLKADRAFAGHRINLLTIVAKALCVAVGRTPSVNASWDDNAGEIIQYHYVNLGIAAATDRGLIVPNIKDADRLNLVEMADALASLTEIARAGTSSPAQLGGGTISITNVGVFGVDAGTPILNPGEAMILAIGAVRRMPWEYQGEIALRQVMTLSVSFDHRLVDGQQGSRFLADVGTILADPGMVLTMV